LISILIPTFNNESTIIRTLNSVLWADEIVVVDSFSNDKTCEIAEEYGAIIIKNEYENSAKQKNWALQYCSNEWIFQIDTDEELYEDSKYIIKNAISTVEENIHCFKMARENYVIGKLVRYGGLYPDWEYRLFRKKYGKWLDKEVHSRVIVDGLVDILGTPIIHHGMPNISKQLSNLDRYTRYEADDLINSDYKFSFIKWIIGPLYIFFKRYIILMGFRDGWRGLFLAVYASFYLFVSHAKLLEKLLLQSKNKSK
tara:strand:- start:1589 stop:2353 length:765 start_codon:yes stop_codon:yes gene_type:complete